MVYTQGEVFDVVAQKGELWLGKNQDDPTGRLGWLWEQVRLNVHRKISVGDIANIFHSISLCSLKISVLERSIGN